MLGRSARAAIETGIGDDAAVLRLSGRVVWTVDAAVEGVHFDRRFMTLDDVGFRSFQAAVSDLAAMGARPVAALSALALPERFSDRDLERLLRGQAEAARALDCPIVGGNFTRASELSIHTTALGSARSPLTRSGARVGDELWLLGDVGLAAAGLAALTAGRTRGAALARCVAAFRRPSARLEDGAALVGRARAALDVSDGLAGDAGHLARASGVRAVISAEQLTRALRPELVRAAASLDRAPLELALYGGEDYALLAAGPAARRPPRATAIGWIERGRGVVLEVGGRRRALGAGYDHFAR